MKRLTVRELMAELRKVDPDQVLALQVSVDVSTGEDDAERRAFGDVVEVMRHDPYVTLLCVGSLNDDGRCAE